MNKEYVLGVLGGMGTYATINLFERYADIFPAEKEWERPRIIIDNRCTMPSRVRAILYNENRDILIKDMAESIQMLSDSGATDIILGCNTSHVFLPEVLEMVPEARCKIIDIIEVCVNAIKNEGEDKAFLLATEGTILSEIYQKKMLAAGITCAVPSEREQKLIRECIEAVKTNHYTARVEELFIKLIDSNNICILGCTELPILYRRYRKKIKKRTKIIDPLELALIKAHNNYLEAK